MLPEQLGFIRHGGRFHTPSITPLPVQVEPALGLVQATPGLPEESRRCCQVCGGHLCRNRVMIARQRLELVLVAVDEQRDVAEVGGEVLHLGAVDEFLALEHAAQQQADDDQHDGDFDQGKTCLSGFHDVLRFGVLVSQTKAVVVPAY
jgi:hypothetical protein